MAIIVQKYGGTSVADPDRIANVANRVAKGWRDGNKMVVVLSAMAGETDRLIRLALELAEDPDPRELDVRQLLRQSVLGVGRGLVDQGSTLRDLLQLCARLLRAQPGLAHTNPLVAAR